MTEVNGAWTRSEMEQFLREALLPLRLGCHHSDGGLWVVALWYRYRDGQFQCATGRGSDLVEFLDANGDVSVDVSTNVPPYMGVRGNGTVTVEPDAGKECLRSLLDRYLGGTDNELASMLLDDKREEVVISVDTERLYTWDFSDRMGDAVRDSPAVRQAEPPSPRQR